MDVGATLREARERAGLSRDDVSQRTKIQLAKIEALEANAFERLPEGIYLDGLVRAYAGEVGLDSRDLVVHMHEQLAAREAQRLANEGLGLDEFRSETNTPDELQPTVAIHHTDEVERAEMRDDVVRETEIRYDRIAPDRATAADEGHDFVAAPFARMPVIEPTPAGRRVARFALPLLAFIAAIALGVYLYQQNRPFQTGEPGAISASNAEAASASGTPGAADTQGASSQDATRTNRSVPPGPEDAVRANETPPSASAHHASPTPTPSPNAPAPGSPAAPVAGARSTPTPPLTPAPGAPAVPTSAARSAAGVRGAMGAPGVSGASSAPGATREGAPGAPSSAPSAPGAPGSAPGAPGSAPSAPGAPGASSAPGRPGAAAAFDLSGFWRMDTRVDSSSLSDFVGLQLGYRLELQQSGNRITGQGIKTLENGKTIAGSAQTPIIVTGTLNGKRMTLTFTERGTQRETAGKMILDVDEDGVLRGRFSSSAAQSSGFVEARRPEG